MLTGIPLGSLSEMERGTMEPSDDDLAVLARLYCYPTPADLMSEAVLAAGGHA